MTGQRKKKRPKEGRLDKTISVRVKADVYEEFASIVRNQNESCNGMINKLIGMYVSESLAEYHVEKKEGECNG